MTYRAGYSYPAYNNAMMKAHSVPYYGFRHGASMFAYGAIGRVTARAGHYDNYYGNYYGGYWGNNPAHYYIGALGNHARSIAVPGGRPVGGPGRAAKKTAPAERQVPADRSTATNNADDAKKAGKAKDDPEAKEREAARKALEKARDGAVSKLVNERGYTQAEAKAIVDMVYDKVKNDGKAAPENFASYINGVPAKMGKDANGRTVKDPTWAIKYGKWVAKLKGANNPDRAAADTCAEFKVQRGRRLRNNVDYARIEEDGTEKIGDKVYARYRVIKGKGRNGEALTGRLYYDKDGGKRKWGTKDSDGQFVALRRQPKQYNKELGVISFGRGRLIAIPRQGLSATQINVAVDEWLKRHPTSKKVDPAAKGYAKDVEDRLVRFFGTKKGKKVVDVTIDNNKNIVITTAKGNTDTETGTNAHFVQQRIRDKKGEFNSIIKGLGKNASVSVDGEFVSGIHSSGAADSAIEILSKKATRVTPFIDVRKLKDGKDVKFENTKDDKKLIAARIFTKTPNRSELKHTKKLIINLRFGKDPDKKVSYAPDKKVIEDIQKKLQEQLSTNGARNCTVVIKAKEVRVKPYDNPDPKKVKLLESIFKAANKDVNEAKKLLKGSDNAFPYHIDTAIKIAYKKLHAVAKDAHATYTAALKKKGRRYTQQRADAELTYKEWHVQAKEHLKTSLGKDEAARFEPDRVKGSASNAKVQPTVRKSGRKVVRKPTRRGKKPAYCKDTPQRAGC
jgi:hypothetical protein